MAKQTWAEIKDRHFSADEQSAIRAEALAELAQLPLWELRQARELTQGKLATLLDRKQAAVSRLERRTDMYVSTLRNYIEAMGGRLRIVAQFEDGSVEIDQFAEIADPVAGREDKAV